jgi:cell division protein FtsB
MKRSTYSQPDLPPEGSGRYTFWQEVKRIKAQLEDDIAQLEQANTQLAADIEAMQTDPFQQEKIAREELNMALPGEIIYKFAE